MAPVWNLRKDALKLTRESHIPIQQALWSAYEDPQHRISLLSLANTPSELAAVKRRLASIEQAQGRASKSLRLSTIQKAKRLQPKAKAAEKIKNRAREASPVAREKNRKGKKGSDGQKTAGGFRKFEKISRQGARKQTLPCRRQRATIHLLQISEACLATIRLAQGCTCAWGAANKALPTTTVAASKVSYEYLTQTLPWPPLFRILYRYSHSGCCSFQILAHIQKS